MESALKFLNELEKSGQIARYGIGGAFALLFYAEPSLTYDLDVFVFLPKNSDSVLVSLAPLYRYLESRGYVPEKEHVIIEGVPIQFIPAYSPIVEDAVKEASFLDYKDTKVRVCKLEYLMAIMLDTHRPKDMARLAQIINSVSFDRELLQTIVKKHGLTPKWEVLLEDCAK